MTAGASLPMRTILNKARAAALAPAVIIATSSPAFAQEAPAFDAATQAQTIVTAGLAILGVLAGLVVAVGGYQLFKKLASRPS